MKNKVTRTEIEPAQAYEQFKAYCKKNGLVIRVALGKVIFQYLKERDDD